MAVPVPPIAARPPAPTSALAPAPVVSEPTHLLPYDHGHFRTGRVLLQGFFTAALIAIGMLALETFMPRYTSTTPAVERLQRQAFDDLRFSIAFPAGWDVVEDRYGVSFYSPERAGRASTRGFRVEAIDAPFKEAKDEASRIDRDRFPEHQVLGTARGRTRSGEDAYKRVLSADDLRLEQWWIEQGKRMLRLEFWSRLADDDASDVNGRIVKTLELR